jgi:chromosome segregation ATPase
MNYAQRNATILSRLDRHAKQAAENCLAIAQNASNRRDELQRELQRNSFLTPEGKRAKLTEELAGAEPRMREARGPIDSAAKGVERLRGQLKSAPVDRTDAVAEMRNAEIRAYVRSMESSLLRSAAMLSDPRIRDAVLDQPAALSGVPELDYQKAKAARDEQVQEQLNGAKLREIEALQAVVDEANAVAGVAANDLASLAGEVGFRAA